MIKMEMAELDDQLSKTNTLDFEELKSELSQAKREIEAEDRLNLIAQVETEQEKFTVNSRPSASVVGIKKVQDASSLNMTPNNGTACVTEYAPVSIYKQMNPMEIDNDSHRQAVNDQKHNFGDSPDLTKVLNFDMHSRSPCAADRHVLLSLSGELPSNAMV